jgi:hypothetical protein
MTRANKIHIPKRPRGRPTEAANGRYEADVEAFAKAIKEINSRIDFKMSSRGWCYTLEEYGLSKGDFDVAQKIINECRKNGLLPIDFVAEEEARNFNCLEEVDYSTPEEYAAGIVHRVAGQHLYYHGISFWSDKDCYVQMLVEKIDLKTLFEPICETYYIPIATSKGWSSILQRAEMVSRYQFHESEGRKPVLLYCGDHDPAGLNISEFLRKNFFDLWKATGWFPDNLIIDRFGLNYDFIEENNLTWIDNLITGSNQDLGSPKHKDHFAHYVQDYIRQYGKQKCEANAVVIRPDSGRQLCREAINKYVSAEEVDDFETALSELQHDVKALIREEFEAEYG